MLETVANNISSEIEMNDLLIKLLELFCKIGVRIKENMEKITKNTQKVIIYFYLITFLKLFQIKLIIFFNLIIKICKVN